MKLEIENLSYTYPDGTKALDSISFSVEKNERVGLVGANGAGKSTLLLHLSGAVENSCARINNERADAAKLRKLTGMVFQNPDDQLFMPKVLDDVAYGPTQQGRADAQTTSLEALKKCGAEHLSERFCHHLSLGEKRAVAIAGAIATDAQLLLMDEPSSNLDPRGRKRLIALLNDLAHPLIVASHDLDMLLETCSRVIIISAGTVAADGQAKDILTDKGLLEGCGLELPLGCIPPKKFSS